MKFQLAGGVALVAFATLTSLDAAAQLPSEDLRGPDVPTDGTQPPHHQPPATPTEKTSPAAEPSGSEGPPPTSAVPDANAASRHSPTPAPPALTPKGPVWIDVQLTGFDVDPELVRIAVAKELALAVSDSAEGSPTQVNVQATAGGDIIVTYQSEDGPRLMRAVTAPARADEVPEVSALLAGNLARDEAGPLLEQLRAEKAREAQAQSSPTEPATPNESRALRPYRVVNLSLFPPLSTVENPEHETINVDFGLFYSHIGGLHGVGLNAGVLEVDGRAEGAQVTGIGRLGDGDGWGARIAGLFGVGEGSYLGLSTAGVFDYGKGDLEGVQLAGASSIQVGKLDGAQASGAVSIARELHGAQISGAASVTNDAVGAQISGAVSVGENVEGLQLSGAANVAQTINGAQIGIINVGGKVEGLQLGVINVADELDGASIGAITVAGSGKIQPVTWYSSTQPLNVGLRLYTGPLYAMPTFGYDPNSSTDSSETKLGLILGGRIPIKRAFVDVDVGYSNPADFSKLDEHTVDLRYRVLAGYSVTDWFGVFAGGGVLHSFRTAGPSDENLDPELSLGVELF